MNDARDRSILDHLWVIARWRRMILGTVFVVCAATVAISLALPKAYRARATVYPPQESQDMMGLSALLSGNLGMGLLGMGEGPVSATDFVPVIQSEQVAEAVDQRFGLSDRYRPETREHLLKMVRERLQVELSREQFLSVSYEDETPQLAAEITNAFVEEMEQALLKRTRERARRSREYWQVRLAEAANEVHEAELAYNRFQQANLAIDLETQAKTQIESAGKMISTLAELIVERDVAARVMESSHPKLKEYELRISGVRRSLDDILLGQPPGGQGEEAGGDPLPFFIPFQRVPELGLQMIQLVRDMKIQEAIYQFVRQEFEKARFEEEREAAAVIVLDRAAPPDSRSRPRRTLMVALAGALSLSVSTLLAFLFEALGGLEGESRSKMDEILRELGLKGRT